jgi:hypothetical protein
MHHNVYIINTNTITHTYAPPEHKDIKIFVGFSPVRVYLGGPYSPRNPYSLGTKESPGKEGVSREDSTLSNWI